jgi:hypothetical protein
LQVGNQEDGKSVGVIAIASEANWASTLGKYGTSSFFETKQSDSSMSLNYRNGDLRAVSERWTLLQHSADLCDRCTEIEEVACPRKSIGIPHPKKSPSLLFVSYNPNRFNSVKDVSDNFWNNPDDGLRKNLLDILFGFPNLRNKANIDGFQSEGFFLVHALKCATKHSQTLQAGRKLTADTLRLCVPQHLQEEVNLLAARNICLLGGVPKQAFAKFSPSVRKWNATPAAGWSKEIVLSYGKVNCLLTCLPIRPMHVDIAKRHILDWMVQIGLIKLV